MESKTDMKGEELEAETTTTTTTTTTTPTKADNLKEGENKASETSPDQEKEGTKTSSNSRRNDDAHDDDGGGANDDNDGEDEEDDDHDDGAAPKNIADADDYKPEDDVGPTLQVEIQNSDDTPEMEEDDEEEDDDNDVDDMDHSPTKDPTTEMGPGKRPGTNDREEQELLESRLEDTTTDPKTLEYMEYIKTHTPESELEIAMAAILDRKESHIQRLTNEIYKFRAFISKRKQVYKRKRKDNGAPTRALSAYNIYVQDRFLQLAKENEAALKSTDSTAQLQRVPPANLVASTGNAWRDLPAEEKAKYEERAKADRKRYEDQMTKYQPPDKQANRKRNKTGYNMFFSAHVLRLKQSELGVPSERGSVARLVGNAWKTLSSEEKQYYEREADKHNGMNPVEKDGEEDDDEDVKRQQQDPYAQQYAPPHEMPPGAYVHSVHPGLQQQQQAALVAQQHDPRHHGYYYPPHPSHQYPYDYAAVHHRVGGHSSRSQHGGYQYPPPQGHGYDQYKG